MRWAKMCIRDRPLWAAAQVLNAPYIAVYRFGIYAFAFMLGYFVFAQEEVIERLAAHPLPCLLYTSRCV